LLRHPRTPTRTSRFRGLIQGWVQVVAERWAKSTKESAKPQLERSVIGRYRNVQAQSTDFHPQVKAYSIKLPGIGAYRRRYIIPQVIQPRVCWPEVAKILLQTFWNLWSCEWGAGQRLLLKGCTLIWWF